MISNRLIGELVESLSQKRELFVRSIRRRDTDIRVKSTRRSNQQLMINNLRSQLFHQLQNLTLTRVQSTVPMQLIAIYDMVYRSDFRDQLMQNQDLKTAVKKLSRLVSESNQLDPRIRQDFCIMAQRLTLLFISLDRDVTLDQTLVLGAISSFLNPSPELSVVGYQLLQTMTTFVSGGREFILSILQPSNFLTMNAGLDSSFNNNYFTFLLLLFNNNSQSPTVQQFTTLVDLVRSQIFKFHNNPDKINQLIRLLYLVLESLGSQEINTYYPSHKVLDLMLDILRNKKTFYPLSCETQFYILEEIEVVLKIHATRLSSVVSPILVKEMLVATLSSQQESRSLAWKILCSLTRCSQFQQMFLDSKSYNIVYFQMDKINYLKYSLLFMIRILPSLPRDSQSVLELTRRNAMQTVVGLLRYLDQDDVSLVQTQLLTLLSVTTFFNQFQQCNGVCEIVSQYGNIYDTNRELYGLAEQILRLKDNLYDYQSYWQPDQSV